MYLRSARNLERILSKTSPPPTGTDIFIACSTAHRGRRCGAGRSPARLQRVTFRRALRKMVVGHASMPGVRAESLAKGDE